MDLLAWVRFESPGYLALLALIPLLIALSYRSLAGLGPVRRWVAVTFRALVVLVMVLALAGVYRTEEIDDLAVIFLVDRSDSIPVEAQRDALRFMARAAEQRTGDDRIGVIAFDGVADVEQTPMKSLELDTLTPPTRPGETSLARAARLALALLPSDTAGRIVLISDGNENVGDILREAEQFSAADIPIDVVPVDYEHTQEVVVEQLRAPPNASLDETINLQLILRAQRPTRGAVLLWHNDTLLDLNGDAPGTGYAVELDAGPSRHQIPVPLRVTGAHRFRAQFVPAESDADTIPDNNLGRSFTVVTGPQRVLLLTTDDDLAQAQPSAYILRDALARESIPVDVRVAGETPVDQVQLLDYSLVILGNVPAHRLRDDEKDTLASYVRDLGGGLVMVGGADSFGAGGWMNSPVEEVMPVSFDIKQEREFFRGALVLVMHACEIPEGNALGERAAIEAVKALSSRDLVGVLAWKWHGQDQEHWVVPLQEVGDRRRIILAIKRMSMGDLPDFDPVMRPGVTALANRRNVTAKHMIVVSDFDPMPARDDLVRQMKSSGITCSTIGIGYGGHAIDERHATWLADSTGGRFYRTNDHSKLPQIFIKESRVVRRSLIQEGDFAIALAAPVSPLVAGLATVPPSVQGLVLTTAKDAATIPIVRPTDTGGDPILAHWQVGLGKTVAFTSGMWPEWAAGWVGWEGFSAFWAQTVRWAARQPEAADFDVTTTVQGGTAKLRVDAIDKNAAAVNFMDLVGKVVAPDNATESLTLTQTGPGRYEAEFDAHERGNYIVDLRYRIGRGPEARTGALQTGVSVAYSPEFSRLATNRALLDQVRETTRGRELALAGPAAVFDRSSMAPAETQHVMWETLVRWLLILFLFDVAVRRIAVSPAEQGRRARRFLHEMAHRGEGQAAEAVLTTLKGTRERVREEQREAAEAGPPPTTRYEAAQQEERATEELGRALGGATESDTPVVGKPSGRRPREDEADYTARLLRAKRRARDDIKKQEEDEESS
jgi:uncharacterized membrane protein